MGGRDICIYEMGGRPALENVLQNKRTMKIQYITGTGIYFDANTYATTANTRVRLRDPHYADEYNGDHTVTMNDLIKALSEISYHNLVYCN